MLFPCAADQWKQNNLKLMCNMFNAGKLNISRMHISRSIYNCSRAASEKQAPEKCSVVRHIPPMSLAV